MSDIKTVMLQIEHGLSEIQNILDEIADAIYLQNIIRSRQLKAQILNIAYVRGQLEHIATANQPLRSENIAAVYSEEISGVMKDIQTDHNKGLFERDYYENRIMAIVKKLIEA